MAFSRRLPRSRLRRKLRGRRTFRKAKRIVRRVKRKLRKRTARKARRKQYLSAYAYASHAEATNGAVLVSSLGSSDDTSGLLSRADVDKIFDQVAQVDDFMYGGQTSSITQKTANRHSLGIRVKGEAIYTISNGNTVGGVFCQFYIARPRVPIPADGIGAFSSFTLSGLYSSNDNSLFQADYNDASGLAVSAAGTGGVTNIMQNSTTTTKPTLSSVDRIWHTPFMVPEVTQHYKILSVKKVFIPPGGVYMFKLKTPWQWLDRSEMQFRQAGNPNGAVFRPRQGREVMVKAWGQPVHDQTTHTLVNVARSTLDCVVSKRYWFSASHKPVPRYFAAGNSNMGTIANAQLPGLADQTVAEA